jgi:hypothetical protein
MATSRTYNLSPDGSTFGQGVDGVRIGVGPGGASRLNGLFENGAFRTNVGIASGHDSVIDARIELRDDDGDLLATRRESLPAHGWVQLNRIFTLDGLQGVERGVAVVRNTAVEGDLYPYASVVDDTTGDPVFVAGGGVATETTPVWVAAAAHEEGVGGAQWRTDLHLTNIGEHDLLATVELFESGSGGVPRPRVNVLILRGDSRTLGDVVADWLGATGNGALRVAVSRGHLMVTSRTFNQTSAGTYGQSIPAVSEGATFVAEDRAALLQLRQDPSFRTNLGFVNIGDDELVVGVEFRGALGVIGTTTYTVAPAGWMQVNGALPEGAHLALVHSSSEQARYLAYASVVDNRSGDPVYVPARLVP